MINYRRFAFFVTTLVILTSVNSKSVAGAESIFSEQLVAQSSFTKSNAEGAFNSQPIIQEKKSEKQSSSDDSDFYNLFTPIVCTLLGYVAGSVVGSKSQKEKVGEGN